jgi:hypothetical protein
MYDPEPVHILTICFRDIIFNILHLVLEVTSGPLSKMFLQKILYTFLASLVQFTCVSYRNYFIRQRQKYYSMHGTHKRIDTEISSNFFFVSPGPKYFIFRCLQVVFLS